jgi:hypothetical protein
MGRGDPLRLPYPPLGDWTYPSGFLFASDKAGGGGRGKGKVKTKINELWNRQRSALDIVAFGREISTPSLQVLSGETYRT